MAYRVRLIWEPVSFLEIARMVVVVLIAAALRHYDADPVWTLVLGAFWGMAMGPLVTVTKEPRA